MQDDILVHRLQSGSEHICEMTFCNDRLHLGAYSELGMHSDYRRLKKCIKQIIHERQERQSTTTNSQSPKPISVADSRRTRSITFAPGTSPEIRPNASPNSRKQSELLGDGVHHPRYGSNLLTPPLNEARRPSPPIVELPPPMQDLPNDPPAPRPPRLPSHRSQVGITLETLPELTMLTMVDSRVLLT